MATQVFITAEQFERIAANEERDYELLDGELIEMASPRPRHNFVVSALCHELRSPTRSVLPDTEFAVAPNTRLRPDVAVWRTKVSKLVDLDRVPVTVPPDIAIEVISPSEHAYRVEFKIQAYLTFGVQEVWTIYPDKRRIYMHTQTGTTNLRSNDTIRTPLLPDWSILVEHLFEV